VIEVKGGYTYIPLDLEAIVVQVPLTPLVWSAVVQAGLGELVWQVHKRSIDRCCY
jgi:hypothetical protein